MGSQDDNETITVTSCSHVFAVASFHSSFHSSSHGSSHSTSSQTHRGSRSQLFPSAGHSGTSVKAAAVPFLAITATIERRRPAAHLGVHSPLHVSRCSLEQLSVPSLNICHRCLSRAHEKEEEKQNRAVKLAFLLPHNSFTSKISLHSASFFLFQSSATTTASPHSGLFAHLHSTRSTHNSRCVHLFSRTPIATFRSLILSETYI